MGIFARLYIIHSLVYGPIEVLFVLKPLAFEGLHVYMSNYMIP